MDAPGEVVKIMGLTEAELHRGLATLGRLEMDGAGGRLLAPQGEVGLTWRVLPSHRLGALRLPVLELRLDLAALTPAARAVFLRRFQTVFQRGGG